MKNKLIIFHLLNITIITILYFTGIPFLVEYVEIFYFYIIFTFAIVFLSYIYVYGFFHLITFFNFTYFIFILSAALKGLVTNTLNEFNSLITVYFPNDLIVEALLISILSFCIINLFFIFFMPKKILKISRNNFFIMISKKIMLISLPLIVIKFITIFFYIRKVGYVAYYAGAINNLNFPTLISFSNIFFYFGFYLFIAGMPNIKEFKVYSLIVIFVMTIDALKGSRSSVVLPILFYFWFLGNYYNINKKKYIKNFLAIGLILVIFSQFLAIYRQKANDDFNVSKIIEFAYTQATSLNVIILYLQNKDNLEPTSIGYIFAPLTFPFVYMSHYKELQGGQSLNAIKYRENLNHRLTYYLNDHYYLMGGGLGTSFIAEILEFGYIGIMLFSILLAYLISAIYIYSNKRIMLFFSYILVTHVLIMSRGSYFVNLWVIMKFIFLYIIFQLIIKLIKKKKNTLTHQIC
ncbi:MAG: O-antigen polysaccharide polymerase Wzy [Candidatus Gracilibacteria bacterium]